MTIDIISNKNSIVSLKLSFIHSFILKPDFPLGKVAGTAVLEKFEKPFGPQKSLSTVNSNLLLASRRNETKRGRRCSHSTWSLDNLWATFPWV